MSPGLLRRAVLVAVVVVGCGGGGGLPDAGHQGIAGTGGSGSGGAGSGGSGGGASIDPAPFLGTWTETLTIAGTGSCAGLFMPITQTGQIMVTVGTTSDLVRASANDTCSIPLTIVGAGQATLARPIQCVETQGTFAFSTWTMTIAGSSGGESASAMLTAPVACPVSVTGTLTR